MEYKDLMKLATALYNKFKNSKLIDLPKNKSRTIKTCSVYSSIYEIIWTYTRYFLNYVPIFLLHQQMRRCTSSTTTHPVDRNGMFQFGKSKPASQRNPSLAVRIVSCLCHSSVRGGVVNYLKGRKSRGELDSSYSTSLALGEVTLLDKHDAIVDRGDARRVVDSSVTCLGVAVLSTCNSARHTSYSTLLHKNRLLPSSSRSCK